MGFKTLSPLAAKCCPVLKTLSAMEPVIREQDMFFFLVGKTALSFLSG